MKQKDVAELCHGVFRIHWKDGGTSLASVGSESDGKRWMAPANWISGQTSRQEHWKSVKKMELIANF